MTKTLKRKVISVEEFKKTPEKRNRMFTIVYKELYGVNRIWKTFQHKTYIYDLLNNPELHQFKIICEDVINE